MRRDASHRAMPCHAKHAATPTEASSMLREACLDGNGFEWGCFAKDVPSLHDWPEDLMIRYGRLLKKQRPTLHEAWADSSRIQSPCLAEDTSMLPEWTTDAPHGMAMQISRHHQANVEASPPQCRGVRLASHEVRVASHSVRRTSRGVGLALHGMALSIS